ncbi:methyltransferase family protein [Aurantiacibacter sp. MUD61]|uniref:methyltransferase family protein n=1 Tax=Aurantiacibacter sp. MUD61 TaxID=3009083 RepID=UPI0022F04375|nr:isoprenylcysteine carboxylmethyltransferase family protein [Aurantiacibacter sp. MUD61]
MNNRIPPPIIGFLTALLMWWVAGAVPSLGFAFAGHRIVAAALVLVGLMIELISVAAFIRAETTVNPLAPDRAEQLVVSGFYRVSRNPMYLGMALLLFGWGLWLGNYASVACVALFVAYITGFQIIPEEAALEQKFGAQFAAYRQKVRRWI